METLPTVPPPSLPLQIQPTSSSFLASSVAFPSPIDFDLSPSVARITGSSTSLFLAGIYRRRSNRIRLGAETKRVSPLFLLASRSSPALLEGFHPLVRALVGCTGVPSFLCSLCSSLFSSSSLRSQRRVASSLRRLRRGGSTKHLPTRPRPFGSSNLQGGFPPSGAASRSILP